MIRRDSVDPPCFRLSDMRCSGWRRNLADRGDRGKPAGRARNRRLGLRLALEERKTGRPRDARCMNGSRAKANSARGRSTSWFPWLRHAEPSWRRASDLYVSCWSIATRHPQRCRPRALLCGAVFECIDDRSARLGNRGKVSISRHQSARVGFSPDDLVKRMQPWRQRHALNHEPRKSLVRHWAWRPSVCRLQRGTR